MPLLPCPDCGKRISDAAPACIHCGRPMAVAAAPRERALPIGPSAMPEPRRSRYACPECGSENTRKLSAIWHDGTTEINATTTGAGVGLGGGLGVGGGRTTGSTRTLSAIGSAPPEKSSFFGPVITIATAGFFALGTLSGGAYGWALLFGAIAGMGAVVAWYRNEYNTTRYPAEKHRWDRSFRCGRCETTFVAEV